ncbi:unnamed protein product [Sphagnum troendelagicum]|uniref:Chaperone DnaJ-domain superfamily protein n=1 Tax=Sphagnum troendelagicum TaxID=128251 RepID=A0ABP0TBW6_9BRYO
MAMVVSSSVHSRLLGSLNSQCANPSSSCSFSPLCRHLSGAKALKTSHNFGIELHLKNVVRGASSFFFPAPFLRAPGQLLRRSQISLKNGVVCTAMDSSFGGSEPAQPIFPRIDVRDPYKRLGVSREASEEEIREAHNYLSNLYAGHKKSLDSIETAYDKIIMESFRDRRKLKSNPASELKKKVRESPAWVRKLGSMTEVPSPKVIALRTVFYILLGIWSVFDSADGGPAFQVAVSFAACIYFLKDRTKKLGRSFIIGFGVMVLGWVSGSFFVPLLPTQLVPQSWSIELNTSLFSYVCLWAACTFLK